MVAMQVVTRAVGPVCKAVKPVNITTMKNATGNRTLEENRSYTLLILREGITNWIGEAIVAQVTHEAMRYIHHRGSISKSLNYMCMYMVLTLAVQTVHTVAKMF